MPKITFSIPVTREIKTLVQGAQSEQVGIIEIKANFESLNFNFGEEPDFDYEYIKYNGADILPLLDNVLEADMLLQYFFKETVDFAREKHLQSIEL